MSSAEFLPRVQNVKIPTVSVGLTTPISEEYNFQLITLLRHKETKTTTKKKSMYLTFAEGNNLNETSCLIFCEKKK